MRAPRHYLLLVVVYLHSSSKEKRATHNQSNELSLLLFFFRSLSFHHFVSLLLFSLFMLSFFLTLFCEKNANSFPSLVQNVQKKFATPIEGQTKKEKREEELLQRIDFFRDDGRRRDYSLETLSSKKIIIQTQGVFTHTHACTHTHTFVSLFLDL